MVVEFDTPGVAEFTKNDGLNDADCCSAWCVFNDGVYMARPDARASSTTVNIYRLISTGLGTSTTEGNGSQIVATITHTAGDVANNNIKWDMFTDGTNMYLFHFHNNSEGWLCHQIDSSFVVTDLTSTVLPEYLTYVNDTTVTSATTSGVVRVLIDQVTNPTSPRYFIYANTNTTSISSAGIPSNSVPWRIYQWQGNASEMAYIDQGGGVLHAFNFGATKTSDQGPWFAERFFNVVSPNITIVDRDYLPSGQIRIYYQVRYTSSHPANLFNVRTIRVIGLYGTDGDLATSQATLTNTSAGTLVGNAATGISINSGIYFVDWDRAADGITENTKYSFRLAVSNE